jgi:hypothetical protein
MAAHPHSSAWGKNPRFAWGQDLEQVTSFESGTHKARSKVGGEGPYSSSTPIGAFPASLPLQAYHEALAHGAPGQRQKNLKHKA